MAIPTIMKTSRSRPGVHRHMYRRRESTERIRPGPEGVTVPCGTASTQGHGAGVVVTSWRRRKLETRVRWDQGRRVARAVAQQVPHAGDTAVAGHVVAAAVVTAHDAPRRPERGLGCPFAGHRSSPGRRVNASAGARASRDTLTASAISGVTHQASPALS